jgi:hypothetical protein
MSKGSKQRPKQISDKEMKKRWDEIFPPKKTLTLKKEKCQ